MESTFQLYNKVKNSLDSSLDVDEKLADLRDSLDNVEIQVQNIKHGFHKNKVGLMRSLGKAQIKLWELCIANGICFNSWSDSVRIQHHANQKQIEEKKHSLEYLMDDNDLAK